MMPSKTKATILSNVYVAEAFGLTAIWFAGVDMRKTV